MSYDIAIIGAGLSGLAAGIRLAHYGKQVVILERHAFPGGLNSFYRRNGEWISVGLHAVTNFAPRENRRAPLNRLLRQLRFRREDFDFCPQTFSQVRTPRGTLRISNDFHDFQNDVKKNFPNDTQGFLSLVEEIQTHDAFSISAQRESARDAIARHVQNQDLIDALLIPIMFYGNAEEDDMDFGQFCIMFRSIFLEGFCRPRRGMRPFIKLLVDRYRQSGGELRLNCGVRALETAGNTVAAIRLDNGETLHAERILSCAGSRETLALASDELANPLPKGQLGYAETMFLLDCEPRSLGLESCIEFFCESERFTYRVPTTPIDSDSGVVCAPGNFATGKEGTERNQIRVTQLANPAHWIGQDAKTYQARKQECIAAQRAFIEKRLPGVSTHIVDEDMFTPKTILRFTGHENGSIYGSPKKIKDGRTPLDNLFLAGTDQGFLGIIGSMMSGASMANLHLLAD